MKLGKLWLCLTGFVFCMPVAAGVYMGVPDNPETLKGCEVLQIENGAEASAKITQPGYYCLDRDYHHACGNWLIRKTIASFIGDSGGCGGLHINIQASDVVLDFRGHKVTWGSVVGKGRNIVVRNGVLEEGRVELQTSVNQAPRPSDAMPRHELLDWGKIKTVDILDKKNRNIAFVNLTSPIEVTNFIVEDVEFKNHTDLSIALTGDRNIIRNNKIEYSSVNSVDRNGVPLGLDEHATDPRVGILNYGPNTLIEDNEIIQHTDNKGVIPAYTIFLRQAEGSIIRGNKITIKGNKPKTIAIGLRKSEGVIIENNLIDGAETPISLEEVSTTQESGNRINK